MSLNSSYLNNSVIEEIFQDYKVHYYYVYVHPVIMLMAVVTNILSGIIFAQKELFSSGPFFQYSLVNSAGAATGMALLSVFCLTRCGPLCSQGYTYWSQAYEQYAVLFVGNSLYFCGSLIQIAISIQLYLSITQKLKRLNDISPVKIVIAFGFVGFGLGTSILFSFKTLEYKYVRLLDDVAADFSIYQNSLDYSNSPALVYLSLFVLIISNKIFLVVLIVINTLLYLELRKIINRKKKLTRSVIHVREMSRVMSSSMDSNLSAVETLSNTYQPKNKDKSDRSKKKTLIMVLWVSVFFSSSRLVFAIANLILLFMQNSVYNWWGSAFNYCYSGIVYTSYLFVYLKTNKIFKKKFLKVFLRQDIQ